MAWSSSRSRHQRDRGLLEDQAQERDRAGRPGRDHPGGSADQPASAPNSSDPGAQPNTFIYYDADGNISTVTGFYENANTTTTDGVDVELRSQDELGDAGQSVRADLNWTHTRKYERTLANGETFEYAGTHGPIVLSAGAGTPKDRASLSLTWDRGPFAVTGVVNYVGPIKFVDHKGETVSDNGDGTVTDDTNGLVYNSNGALRTVRPSP